MAKGKYKIRGKYMRKLKLQVKNDNNTRKRWASDARPK